jgi:4-hydroxybutyrate dehydrogenase/sulfolactaldehyde 3-reductase
MARVGFIGLGAMGRPIARNIVKAGHALTVCDLDQRVVSEFVGLGAKGAPTPAAVAAASEIVFTMVPDAPDSEKVALGAGGVIEGIAPDSIYVEMSTIDPDTVKRIGAALAKKRVRMIDCPVGRTTKHAEEGKLVLMIGGEAADIAAVQPIFDKLADTFIHCGPLGTGVATKVVNNFLALSCAAASSEALTLGVKAGLSVEHMLNVFRSTMAANNQALIVMPQFVLAGKNAPGFPLQHAHKDVRLALDMARGAAVKARVGQAALDTLTEARRLGHDKDDASLMIAVSEAEAGIKVRLKSV